MENKISPNKAIEILNKERKMLAVELVELKDMNIYPDTFVEDLKDRINTYDLAIDAIKKTINKQ